MDYPLGAKKKDRWEYVFPVLIPILMDYPLGGTRNCSTASMNRVLIPILMDYPLGAVLTLQKTKITLVLIPILMDYPLGETEKDRIADVESCLNPYSNGLPSRGFVEPGNTRIDGES